MPLLSETIRTRLRDAGVPFNANDTIAEHLKPGELEQLEAEVMVGMQAVLESLVIDTENDHNTKGTAKRIAKMFVREVFAGRYEPEPSITEFPNHKKLDELYTLGPITVRSACSHHFCPIEGELWCGVVPTDRVMGISKFARLAHHIFARPQIQEEATVQLADRLEKLLNPRGLAVVVKARHACMTWRGVKENGTVMTSSVTRGLMRESSATRGEFLTLIQGAGFQCR